MKEELRLLKQKIVILKEKADKADITQAQLQEIKHQQEVLLQTLNDRDKEIAQLRREPRSRQTTFTLNGFETISELKQELINLGKTITTIQKAQEIVHSQASKEHMDMISREFVMLEDGLGKRVDQAKEAISSAVKAIKFPVFPKIPEFNLTSVVDGLKRVQKAVENIKFDFKWPSKPTEAIPVRMSDGKKFIDSLERTVFQAVGGGATSYAFDKQDSSATKAATVQVSIDGKVRDVLAILHLYDTSWVTARARYTSSQTNTAIVTAAAGERIIVKKLLVDADNANTNDTGFIIGFHATTTPTGAGAIASHPGVPAGGGVSEFWGDSGVSSQTLGDDLRITSEDPGGNLDVVITYKIV